MLPCCVLTDFGGSGSELLDRIAMGFGVQPRRRAQSLLTPAAGAAATEAGSTTAGSMAVATATGLATIGPAATALQSTLNLRGGSLD